MRNRDLHQPRTFLFRPGETVTLKVNARSANSAGKLRALPGQHPVRAKGKTLVFRMPKEGLGLSTAQLDVSFGGRWDRLHLDTAGVEVSLRGSKGTAYKHRILPGPKVGRWTYRIVSAAPRSLLHFCPEPACERRMVPTADGSTCPACGKRRMMALEVPA